MSFSVLDKPESILNWQQRTSMLPAPKKNQLCRVRGGVMNRMHPYGVLLLLLAACSPPGSDQCEPCKTTDSANQNPTIAPLAAEIDGQWARMAEPGTTVIVRAHAADKDGDRLRYRWIVMPDSGTLRNIKPSIVEWEIGEGQQDHKLHLVVSDGRGGYAKETLRLPTRSEVIFGGKVVSSDGKPIEGASVAVNGEESTTDSEGAFKLPIAKANAPRFVLNIRKWGYGLVSRTYDQSVNNGKWTMLPATIQSVDPTQAIIATDILSQSSCTGSLTSGINWNDYPNKRIPRITDTFGQLAGGPIPTDITQALDIIFGGTACSPGISISIPANALVDDAGNAPTGNVELSLSTIDLYAPDSMPGDYSVRTKEDVSWMQSYGAGGIEIRSNNVSYQLKSGQTAELVIPVDPNQRRQKEKIPETIPLLLFNEDSGEWTMRGQAKLSENGESYVAKIDHLSQFNTDLIKTDQACIRFRGDSLVNMLGVAGEFELDAIFPLGAAAPVVRNWHISPSVDASDAADPNLHVIVNLPSDTWVTLVPMRAESGQLIPYGIFGANSGPAQNPTDPNFPVFPYIACANELVLTDIGGSINIVVDGAGRGDGPYPIHLFALSNPVGDDIYPLNPTAGAFALYSLYDTGTSKVRISDVVPKLIGGNVPNSDAGLLNLFGLHTVNVRLNGLNRQDPLTCNVPINPPATPFEAQVEVAGIATRDFIDKKATLIGTAVVNELVAHIDYQQMINIPACAGLASPASGPYMDFFLPGDTSIPNPDLILTLERFGTGFSGDGSTTGRLYWLRNVIFQEGIKVVADDRGATDPFDFLFDTGTPMTIINDRMAVLLGLAAGGSSFDCYDGTNNGYYISSITAMGIDGTYRIENAGVCWQESAIVGSNIVDAVIGSNLFDQVQIVIDGPNNTLGIIQ